jgi:hypothetical protein
MIIGPLAYSYCCIELRLSLFPSSRDPARASDQVSRFKEITIVTCVQFVGYFALSISAGTRIITGRSDVCALVHEIGADAVDGTDEF